MVKKKGVYYCQECGNVVESLWDGKPAVSCCGKPMQYLDPKKVDGATEKHKPVIVREGNKVTVKVGEVAHPMEPAHYILFVEVIDGDKVYRQDFTEKTAVAEATFVVEGKHVVARAFCNKHGFWDSE